MNIDASPARRPGDQLTIRGRWSNVRWRPSASTGEVLNIGVFFQDATGGRWVKMLDTYDRIACLYDKSFAADVRFLAKVVQEALRAGSGLPTSSVFLSEPKFASGSSTDQVLAELYSVTVPLGVPRRDRKQKHLTQHEPDDVRRVVFDELRRISGLAADRIIATEESMQVWDGSEARYLDIPLQTPQALGTIVSTCFSTPSVNELNLLRADSDLQTARRVYSRDKLLMYVVRPPIESNLGNVDRLIEGIGWKFREMGVTMKTYFDPALVANDILEDMPI
jgi:hypothetical protein